MVSKTGQLLGLHLESVYHEDHGSYQPPKQQQVPDMVVSDKHWRGMKLGRDNFQDKSPEDVGLFAAENVKHKQSLGVFVPINVLRAKLLECGIFSSGKRRRSQ